MSLTHQGEQQLAAAIVCLSLSTLAVILRFWCKFVLKNGLHWDDWWMLTALVTYTGGLVAQIWGIFTGAGGLELPQLAAELAAAPSLAKLGQLENYLESLFLSVTISFFVLLACKLSILFMYQRIFSTRRYRIASAILMGISLAWFIAAFVADLVICVPVDHFWHRLNAGRCLNFDVFFIAINITEVILDTVILAIPIWGTLSLQMRTRTRALVIGIFLVGCFSIITNIIRLYYSYQPNAAYVAFNKSTLWTNIHIATTVICGCLPVYSPIRSHVGNAFHSLRERYGSSWQSIFTRSKSKGYAYPNDSLELSGYKEQPSVVGLVPKSGGLATNVVTARRSEASQDSRVPPGTISRTTKVERSIEVV